MLNLTKKEKSQLFDEDTSKSKELQRKKELFSIIQDEKKLRRSFSNLLINSYEDDGKRDSKTAKVSQRLDHARIERTRFFSTNPPSMMKRFSLPTMILSDEKSFKLPVLKNQNEFPRKVTRTLSDSFKMEKLDCNIQSRKTRSVSQPDTSKLSRKRHLPPRKTRLVLPAKWNYKLHKRRYDLFP